uniref:Uncharacterized protein n=1 Tax=Arundo donax TaxID=35708 RepID=A0A0A9H3U1_ARUDO
MLCLIRTEHLKTLHNNCYNSEQSCDISSFCYVLLISKLM